MNDQLTQLITILCEINNRLSDIALSLQTIGLMNTSIKNKENLYSFLCEFAETQKMKYRDSEHLTNPYNHLTGKYDS